MLKCMQMSRPLQWNRSIVIIIIDVFLTFWGNVKPMLAWKKIC